MRSKEVNQSTAGHISVAVVVFVAAPVVDSALGLR